MACNAGPDIIEDGLVFCVDAANINSYPKSGTTWSDLAGSNDGTMQSMSFANYSPDNGGSLIFDGASDYVSLPENGMSYPNTNSDFTLEVIAKVNTFTPQYQVFFQQEDSGGTGRTWLGVSDFDTYYTFLGGSYLGATRTLSVNTVYHMILKYDSGTLFLGLDGSWEHYSTKSIDENSTGSFRIGSGKSTLHPVNGNIYSVKIYNRALTADEVRQNYEATVGRFT
jgi:hypothetical protein